MRVPNNSLLSGEKIKLSDIQTNVVRHSNECLATIIGVKMKLSYICHKCLATVMRLSHDSRQIYLKTQAEILQNCRINVHSMRLQHEICIYIVSLCREIVAN